MTELIRRGGTIVLVRDRDVPEASLRDALRLLQRHPGPLHFELHSRAVELPNRTLSADELFDAVRTFRRRWSVDDAAFVCVLTDKPNKLSWFFMVADDDPSSGFLHVDDWRWITSAPQSALIAYLLIVNLFAGAAVSSDIDLDAISHQPSIGCIGDLCMTKSDVALGLRTADICPRCLEHIESIGAHGGLLQQVMLIFDDCRSLALSTGRYRKQPPQFAAWPHPIAVTRHKAANARDPFHRHSLLLEHFESLVRYLVIAMSAANGHPLAIGERQSLGTWVEALGTIPLQGDAAKHRAGLMKLAWEIVPIRNNVAHGPKAESTDDYREPVTEMEARLTTIEDRTIALLGGWQLVIPISISIAGGYRVLGDHLVGSNAFFPPFEVMLPPGSAPLELGLTQEKRVYLHNAATGRFVSLHPYIQRSECPECRQSRVLIADEQPTQGSRYFDSIGSHRVNLRTQ